VEIGYFAQDQTNVLDPNKTVLGEMTAAAPYDMVPRLRDILGAFLFAGDAVDKPTSVLSGGERNRLALATLLLRSVNCLLLDEPTNHLDIHAKDVLLEALANYEGTIVLVSHDRYILDALPQCVIEVGQGRATRYLGNYEDYLTKKAAEEAATQAGAARAAPLRPTRPAPMPSAVAKKSNGADANHLADEIARFEEEQAKLSEELSRPDFYVAHPDPNGLLARYAEIKRQVDELYRKLDEELAR
jgi:ATP-binding cassette subfamily F protein 3